MNFDVLKLNCPWRTLRNDRLRIYSCRDIQGKECNVDNCVMVYWLKQAEKADLNHT